MSYQLNENVAVDLIKFVQSNTIRNEEQFLLLSLAYTSGLFDDTHDYVSSVCIGTSSSGKSHLKDKVDEVFSKLNIMDASTGSDKALIYDDEWDDADVVSMGELQQPSEEMLEFMKRAHGGDEEVVIRSTRGNPAQGFETEVIRKPAKGYHFTYAQFEADFEFWNRLLKVPVHESESKNRAVGRMAAGHHSISLGDSDVEYGFEFEDGKKALQNHMADVKYNAPKHAVLPNGGDDHDWDCWEIVKPIFNHSRSESNRVYAMVFNIIKASALLNYKHRDRVTKVDDGEEYEAVLVDPEDVVNVIRCLETLRATTHEIDRKKRAIVEGIRAKSGPDDAIEGVGPIREFLKESDAPEVKQGELENILADLADNFLIHIAEGAGEGGRDVYRAYQWDKLGRPRIDENADLFEDTIDPINGEPFLDTWKDLRANLETTAQDLLKTAEIESSGDSTGSSSGSSGSSGSGLGAFGGGIEEEEEEVELNPWTEEVLDRISPVLDGSRIPDMKNVPVESFLGLASIEDPDLANVSTDGTMLDPTHSVWDQPSKPDEWVETETEARIQIQEAIDELIEKEVVRFAEVHETEHGSPVDATLSIVYP